MSEVASDLVQVETDIANLKRTIDRLKKLERLEENQDFKELISEGYLKDEAVRVVHLLADMGMRSAGEVQITWLEDMITGIGAFNQWLNFVRQTGHSARERLAEYEETREELLKEGLQ